VPLSFYVVSLGVVLAGQVAYAWRWRLLLGSRSVTFAKSFGSAFIASSTIFYPDGGWRRRQVYYLGQHHGYRTVTASAAIDRLLGVNLLALAAGALWVSRWRRA
jgi:hypothetical protein